VPCLVASSKPAPGLCNTQCGRFGLPTVTLFQTSSSHRRGACQDPQKAKSWCVRWGSNSEILPSELESHALTTRPQTPKGNLQSGPKPRSKQRLRFRAHQPTPLPAQHCQSSFVARSARSEPRSGGGRALCSATTRARASASCSAWLARFVELHRDPPLC
jgi:hypothetical protein